VLNSCWHRHLLHSSLQLVLKAQELLAQLNSCYYNQDLCWKWPPPWHKHRDDWHTPISFLHLVGLQAVSCTAKQAIDGMERPMSYRQRAFDTTRDYHQCKIASLGLGVIHFQGSWLQQVSCYTLLSRLQPSCPLSCYQEPSTPFVGSK